MIRDVRYQMEEHLSEILTPGILGSTVNCGDFCILSISICDLLHYFLKANFIFFPTIFLLKNWEVNQTSTG